MRLYWLDQFPSGRLGMMARPRGNDWLEDEIKKLHLLEVKVVVSLLEKQEEKELEIELEKDICVKYGIEFISFPVPDRGVPNSDSDFVALVDQIEEQLDTEKKVVVHCRMGIGRTSVLVAGLLIRKGVSSENVFTIISEGRQLEVPDTENQINWIKRIEDKLRK